MPAFLKRGISVQLDNRVVQVESAGIMMTTTGLTVTAPSVKISEEDRYTNHPLRVIIFIAMVG
jgi:hypothetical protein